MSTHSKRENEKNNSKRVNYSESYCCITNLQTKNKWKGNPVHGNVIRKAKNIVSKDLTNLYTVRDAVIQIQNEIRRKSNRDHSNQERLDMLNEVLAI